jgi:solute carrier family 35 protein F1/2
MKAGDAAIFNLSLLTSDFFAVVAAKYLFNETLSNLYYLGFFLIISGIILYNKSPHPTSEYALEEDKSNEPGVQMKLLDEDKKYSV